MTNPLQYYTQLVYYGTKLLPDIEVVRDIVISILLEKEEDINILYLTVRNRCIGAGGEDRELNIEYELIEVAMLEEMSKIKNMENKDQTPQEKDEQELADKIKALVNERIELDLKRGCGVSLGKNEYIGDRQAEIEKEITKLKSKPTNDDTDNG